MKNIRPPGYRYRMTAGSYANIAAILGIECVKWQKVKPFMFSITLNHPTIILSSSHISSKKLTFKINFKVKKEGSHQMCFCNCDQSPAFLHKNNKPYKFSNCSRGLFPLMSSSQVPTSSTSTKGMPEGRSYCLTGCNQGNKCLIKVHHWMIEW